MSFKNPSTKTKLLTSIISVGITLVVVILVTGFMTGEKHVKEEVQRLYSVGDAQFLRAMGVVLGPASVNGNTIEPLKNGDEIFPAMLKAIREAEKTITFETYIYWSDQIGKEFAEALAERSRNGVKVHLLIDWLGSNKMDPQDIAVMQQAGVQIEKYHQVYWYNPSRFNNRTHRKILVVDGRIGFTGGVGIAEKWTGHAQDSNHWRDSHFRVQGPVVAQMQAVFMDNWIKVTGKVLHGAEYFPPLDSSGPKRAQMFSSSSSGGSESMRLMYLIAITAAEHSLYLSSAYFVPDALTSEALVDALKRGVKVQIIAPGPHMDNETVRGASRARWGNLLEAGAEIYEYQPTMYHCKVMIVDEAFTSVGSTNFDPRSFGLNDEVNLNIYDADFARQQIETFQQDLTLSHHVTFKEWSERPLLEKLWEHAASLLGPML